MLLKARRLGGIIVLLTYAVHLVVGIRTRLEPTLSDELVSIARIYVDAASGWVHFAYFLSSIAWIFGGFAHGVFLLKTSRPQRALALIPILGCVGMVWSSLAILAGGPIAASSGGEGPSFGYQLSVMLILLVIQLLDIVLPPWSRIALSRLQQGVQKAVPGE